MASSLAWLAGSVKPAGARQVLFLKDLTDTQAGRPVVPLLLAPFCAIMA